MMAVLLLASSCEDYLNVNTNPNQAVGVQSELVLPQAIVASAERASSFNNMGAHFGGFSANAGGFSGFGTLLTYQLSPGDYNGLWTTTYQDPLRDFKYVIDNTEGNFQLIYMNSAAKIMSAYLYMKLVDTFGNIPYSQALRAEEGIVAPVYDQAADVYADLIVKLDEAYDQIESVHATDEVPVAMTAAVDPLYSDLIADGTEAQMLEWKRFANTLKLKMLVRTNAAAAAFADPDFEVTDWDATTPGVQETGGFITDDVIVDPGYDLSRPNPTWATWGRTVAGALAGNAQSRIPTTYSYAFYNSTKLDDAGRGQTIFKNFPTTPNNQLGNEVGNPPIIQGEVTWEGSGANAAIGVLKGPEMGQPLMLLAEAKFLLAEAKLTGKVAALPGTDLSYFNEGIEASFAYLYKNEAEAVTQNVAPLVAAYKAANDDVTDTDNDDHLVNYAEASDNTERLEAIITQKYIAVNMINSDEAYNEFRRTGFPRTQPGGAPAADIASNKSNLSTPDRLPTRVMYPSSELSFNPSNYVDIDYETVKIFWDLN